MPRPRPTLAAVAASLAAAVASLAGAGSSLLHVGMNDPAAEGFTKTVVGTDPSPAPGNDGLPYWEVDASDAGTSFFSYSVPQTGFDDMLEVRVDGSLVGTLARTSIADQRRTWGVDQRVQLLWS